VSTTLQRREQRARKKLEAKAAAEAAEAKRGLHRFELVSPLFESSDMLVAVGALRQDQCDNIAAIDQAARDFWDAMVAHFSNDLR